MRVTPDPLFPLTRMLAGRPRHADYRLNLLREEGCVRLDAAGANSRYLYVRDPDHAPDHGKPAAHSHENGLGPYDPSFGE